MAGAQLLAKVLYVRSHVAGQQDFSVLDLIRSTILPAAVAELCPNFRGHRSASPALSVSNLRGTDSDAVLISSSALATVLALWGGSGVRVRRQLLPQSGRS